MPLTAAQTTPIFEILGIPQSGSGDVFGSVATLFGPEFESYDMSAIVSRITAKLAALSAEQITRVTAVLDRHTAITATSPLKMHSSSGASGVIADHPAERDMIRTALGNILGIAVPAGGFMAEAQRGVGGGGIVER